MSNEQNNQDKSRRQLAEQELNKAASENMAINDAEQNAVFRANQNLKTQSTDSVNDTDALSNNNEPWQSHDSISLEEKNKRKLESEKDADFGNEQLQ